MVVDINTDIEGVIRELNLSEADVLFPFFEAVVNSIQSIHEIQEAEIKKKGEVSIFIERDKQELSLFEKEGNYPIKSIRIVDNGIGFNNSNYRDGFLKSHSTKKQNLGGKGMGRFTMLSVFDSIKIKSTYKESLSDKNLWLRSFELSRKEGLIANDPILSNSEKNITEITLSNINPKFKQATARYSQEDIADSILEHCLLYYLGNEAPLIRIIEN